MKLIVEPDDGVTPLLAAIRNAEKSVEMAIFRFDRSDIEGALKAAVSRGVKVNALIAYANRGGEKNLRKLEMRFLDAGIIVARSANDLGRYHDKLVVVDRRQLYMLSFNYTHVDIDHSRGFGIVTENAKWVQEAVRLLEADSTRRPYTAGVDTFIVSPANSRPELATFLRRAKKQLLIYDPKISDREMIRILQERAKAGVDIRIIGKLEGRVNLPVRKLAKIRLHTRTIVRDRHQAFVGSQSLRRSELDSRRELGLIVREQKVVKRLLETFESDWAAANDSKPQEPVKEPPAELPSKEVAVQALVEELQPLTETVKDAVKKVIATAGEEVLEGEIVKDTVKKVVKKAVKEAVREMAEDTKAIE